MIRAHAPCPECRHWVWQAEVAAGVARECPACGWWQVTPLPDPEEESRT